MRLNWKDFLYFQKSDRNAIVLLLLLIVIAGVFIIAGKSYWIERNIEEQQRALNEFNKFQNESMPQPLSVDGDENEIEEEVTSAKPLKKTKAEIIKLKEGETIELNGASITTLKRIPGVGDEYARRIMEYRNQLGGFISLEQLTEIKGITKKRYTNISMYLVIKNKHKRIRVNNLSKDALLKHPYVNESHANAIIKKREEAGKILSIDELKAEKAFSSRDLNRLSEYLSFD